MELTRSNLEEWKKEYDKIFFQATKLNIPISSALSDAQILEMHLGLTPKEGVEEELQYWVD